ncbi:MAG: helix-turn-helix domain-containing protein [Firmicutes bacterium]|nr:helix-turn-helix domain-containing protein [Bacillota bacterium]
MSEFGNRLRKLRREADVTQKQLAEVLGIVQTAVGKYECLPNSYPSVEVLIKIADYFNVSIDYLLRGTQPTTTTENNVSGDLMNSTVIQANRGGTVFNGDKAISPEAEELLHIYDKLGVRERLKLLNFAVELEERSKVI